VSARKLLYVLVKTREAGIEDLKIGMLGKRCYGLVSSRAANILARKYLAPSFALPNCGGPADCSLRAEVFSSESSVCDDDGFEMG
jgi:hypothetical protein